MQLSFRLDKRPGESHLVLDGKKVIYNKFADLGNHVCSFMFKLCLFFVELEIKQDLTSPEL